jgi:hypothetical protein
VPPQELEDVGEHGDEPTRRAVTLSALVATACNTANPEPAFL